MLPATPIPLKVTSTRNFTESIGTSNYSYYLGTYSVVVPNNQSYGVAVRLAFNENASSLSALSLLPLYALTPVIVNYNIDCSFESNDSLSNINCMSD